MWLCHVYLEELLVVLEEVGVEVMKVMEVVVGARLIAVDYLSATAAEEHLRALVVLPPAAVVVAVVVATPIAFDYFVVVVVVVKAL